MKILKFTKKCLFKWIFKIRTYFTKDDTEVMGWPSYKDHINIENDLLKKINFTPKDIVLDVGCGTGLTMKRLSPLVKSIIGIDNIKEILNRARNNTKKCSNVKLLYGEGKRLPFTEKKFTKVICHGVFQYLEDINEVKEFIKEMVRISKPRTKIFIGETLDITKKKIIPPFEHFKTSSWRYKGLAWLHTILAIIVYHLLVWCDAEDLINYCSELGVRGIKLSRERPLLNINETFDFLIEV